MAKIKKRKRITEEGDDHEAKKGPQEMTILEHLSNLYTSCNNSKLDNQNIVVPANVIVKTSFKEFHVHDFAVKRSGLFRTMIDSNEQWKLGKIDGKFNIDLSSVENLILPEEEDPLNETDFDIIFNYLYSDNFYIYMNLKSLIRIFNIAKYLDIPSLINMMLSEHSFNYFQIKYLVKEELTEDEIVELVFILERDSSHPIHDYSVELVNYICKQRLVPLSIKIHVLKKKLSFNQDKISKKMLKPFLESIKIMREESKFCELNHSIKEENSDMIKLLKLNGPKEEESLWRHKYYRCATIADISMEACSDSHENFTIMNQIELVVTCSENNSAYWWDLKFLPNFEDNEEGIQLNNRTFYQAYVGSEYQSTKEFNIFDGEETIYAPQFDTGGFSAKLLLYFERSSQE